MELYRNCEICECEQVHEAAVEHVRNTMEDTQVLCVLSDFFKVMSDSTRVRILSVLEHGELCVCDLSQVLGMTKSAVSHQLRVLKDAQLVRFRKEGKNVFYSLKDEHVKMILDMGIAHIKEKD